jgi:hypothetical protein
LNISLVFVNFSNENADVSPSDGAKKKRRVSKKLNATDDTDDKTPSKKRRGRPSKKSTESEHEMTPKQASSSRAHVVEEEEEGTEVPLVRKRSRSKMASRMQSRQDEKGSSPRVSDSNSSLRLEHQSKLFIYFNSLLFCIL